MSKYDLHPTQVEGEYLLDVQTDLLDVQSTRMMVPVLPETAVPNAVRSLHPAFDMDGKMFVMATHLMGAVPRAALRPPIRNFAEHGDQITRALDFLFQGY
ncbi:CcdB family protein [Sulfitobacter sp. MF3-043]|uniref:CcdB family protein n=1 Tax=Sulfitobacter sediminivivens TaxID=3252902 RepID=UPI0036DB2C82